MSIVEKLQRMIENPVSQARIDKLQTEINFAVNSYYVGEFSKEELDYILKVLNEENNLDRLELHYPGPLYGLLRKANLSQTDARSLADEERAHYFSAVENDAHDPYFVLYVAEENGKRFVNVFLSYQPDFTESDEKIKQSIFNISMAPYDPSIDDLAKIFGG